MRFIVYLGLLLALLGAQEVSLATPKDMVQSYYYAMNNADIELLKSVMVKESFDMTIEVWALSVALKDKAFHKVLKQYGSAPEVDKQVQEAVRKKLQTASPKTISDLQETPLGKSRCMIRYKENGKKKQLYTSLHGDLWKIDYMAGRQID
jgi:hypothetical protein